MNSINRVVDLTPCNISFVKRDCKDRFQRRIGITNAGLSFPVEIAKLTDRRKKGLRVTSFVGDDKVDLLLVGVRCKDALQSRS